MLARALTLLLSVALALAWSLGSVPVLAQAPPPLPPQGDTLIPAHVPYKGYRLHVREARLIKQRRGRYLVAVKVVNTGARDIGLGPGFPLHFLQTVFDDALTKGGLLPLATGIRRALVDEAVSLVAGEAIEELKCWVTPQAATRTPTAKTDEIEVTYRERLPQKQPKPGTQEGEASWYASAKPVPPPPPPDADHCVDLKLAAIDVLRRRKRSALVELTLTNIGTRTLKREDLGAGSSLDLYLGGGAEVTAASKRLARIDLAQRIGPSLGQGLASGRSVAITERLDLSSLSRYTRVLVAQLDPGQVIPECDETNNETNVVLRK